MYRQWLFVGSCKVKPSENEKKSMNESMKKKIQAWVDARERWGHKLGDRFAKRAKNIKALLVVFRTVRCVIVRKGRWESGERWTRALVEEKMTEDGSWERCGDAHVARQPLLATPIAVKRSKEHASCVLWQAHKYTFNSTLTVTALRRNHTELTNMLTAHTITGHTYVSEQQHGWYWPIF